jgi:hypothetical protein
MPIHRSPRALLFLPLARVLGLLPNIPDTLLDVGPSVRDPVADPLASASRCAGNRVADAARGGADRAADRGGEATYLAWINVWPAVAEG